ncbi:transcription-associated protein 1 [Marasmius crinis-equi]|uniref:Transcription-associated protein 1 n=1 Tax=Marasmius crinis-equi TaxID=585013 RepID=A0ABR3EWD0_9AGAR
MKEKAQILLKMVSFETRAENLFHSFLELVHEIYTEPALRRSDLTVRLEPLFFVGCRAKDSALRERFMDLLDSPSSIVRKHKISLSPMQHLAFLDPLTAQDSWVATFSAAWSCLSRREQGDITNLRDDKRDYVCDSLADVYSGLAEDDLFYGLCRRRSLHRDTEVAIAFKQNGMWEQAIGAYETAQTKARSGTIPFSESEYCLWEDHWILASEKLQQCNILYDLGSSEGNYDLMLESAWRTKDWSENREALEGLVTQLPEVATPRRRVFEAFLALLKNPSGLEKNVEFTRILEDAMQMALCKWVALSPHLSTAHVPLLQHFQQFVELQEAVQIFASLSATTAQNLEKKSVELKMALQAWRERLPNLHDDISIWSDLVAWCQNGSQ